MTETIEVLQDEPMARHTSWRVGGSADTFFRPRSVESLASFLRALPPDTPLTWIGLGSNLLVRDGGIRGVTICTSGLPRDFTALGDGRVRAGAGLPCATFSRRLARLALGPAAFFAGIPGTMGGALAMNAGAFGGETWDCVAEVETIDRGGNRRTRPKADYEIGYRTVRGPAEEWFLGAVFQFDKQGSTEIATIRTLLDARSASQPIGAPSAGSVFRNPRGFHAAALIEQAGLKGLRIGGAVVSDKHANFILNAGAASAADIEALIAQVRRVVEERAGVLLEPEVRIVGVLGGEAS